MGVMAINKKGEGGRDSQLVGWGGEQTTLYKSMKAFPFP